MSYPGDGDYEAIVRQLRQQDVEDICAAPSPALGDAEGVFAPGEASPRVVLYCNLRAGHPGNQHEFAITWPRDA